MKFAFLLIAIFFAGCQENPKSAIPRLIEQLNSQIASERNSACQRLAEYGPAAEPATKALAKRLYDENLGIRSSAAYALRKIGTADATRILESYKR